MNDIELINKQISFINLRLKVLYDHLEFYKEFLNEIPYLKQEIEMFESIKNNLLNLQKIYTSRKNRII